MYPYQSEVITIGDRVFYCEDKHDSKSVGFGLVIDKVYDENGSEKYKFAIHEKKLLTTKVFLILKDNGQLEEFLEADLKKVVDF